MNSKKKFISFFVLAGFALTPFSCVSLELRLNHEESPQAVSAFHNNGTVRLSYGVYRGDFTIDANSVSLLGQGIGRTRIDGDIRINGNNAVLRYLSVRGDVYINGNNADLSNARIEGRVFSSGHGNRW